MQELKIVQNSHKHLSLYYSFMQQTSANLLLYC